MEVNEVVTNIPQAKEPFKVEYEFVPFHRRALASLLDAVLFILLFICLFVSVRGIVSTTPEFKTAVRGVNEQKVNSCLYLPSSVAELSGNKIIEHIELDDKSKYYDEKEYVSLTSVLKGTKNFSSDRKIEISTLAIEKYFAFIKDQFGSDYTNVYSDYLGFFSKDAFKDKDGNPYFILNSDGFYCFNESVAGDVSKNYAYENVIEKYLNNNAEGWLVSAPSYKAHTNYFMLIFFTLEIPISYLFSAFLVYLLPTFFFRHGRMSIGKLVYKIAVIDKNLFAPSFSRNLIRFLIFLFAELILSLVSFGVPFVISTTMMAFSKKKQSFPDYMLGMYEVDASKNKIYLNDLELTLEDVHAYKQAVDFKRKKDISSF